MQQISATSLSVLVDLTWFSGENDGANNLALWIYILVPFSDKELAVCKKKLLFEATSIFQVNRIKRQKVYFIRP